MPIQFRTMREMLDDPEEQRRHADYKARLAEPLSLHEMLIRPQGDANHALDEFDEQDFCAKWARDAWEVWRALFTFAGPGISLDKVAELPHAPAVYWLNCPLDSNCNSWRMTYIGKARDLHHRWTNQRHHRFEQAESYNCRLQWWELPAGTESIIEAVLIYHVKPTWNERD